METNQFDLQLKCFRLLGFYPVADWKLQLTLRGYQLFCIMSVIFCDVSQSLFVARNYKDVLECAEAAATLLTSLLVTSKILTLFIWKKQFFELIAHLRQISNELLDEADYFEVKRVGKIVASLYLMSCAFVSFAYCIFPILVSLKEHYMFGNDFHPNMPFKTEFLFDASTFPGFQISYALLSFSSFVAVMSVAVDSAFFGFSLCICAHFNALRSSFDGGKKKFVHRHLLILDVVEKLNHLIKPIVFAQFFISSMQLCVIWFQVFMHESFLQLFVDCVFGFALCLQLFFYTYGGQQIMEKSSEVADGLFELDVDVVIIIARAQKAAKISSGYYTAAMPAFTAILSASTSLMTLWKSFID